MVAVIARTGSTVDAIDGFCGVGGSSQGILAAGATLRAAFNHNELNIETHAENFPDVDHWLADVSDAKNPEHVNRKGKKVPGRYVDPADLPAARFAWFSPGCFVAGTLILTERGLVPIEDVAVGDMVVTHAGRLRRVTHTLRRMADTIVVKGQGHPGLETTHEHPFYVRRVGRLWNNGSRQYDRVLGEPQWVPAANIGNLAPAQSFLARFSGYFWATPRRLPILVTPIVGAGKWRRSFALDEFGFWLIGRWLGDGYLRLQEDRGKEVHVTCGTHEAEDLGRRLDHWGRTGVRARGAELHWASRVRETTVDFYASHTGLAEWLAENFGQHAHEKSLPLWVLTMQERYRRALLDGYLSADGHRQARDNGSSTWAASTVSKRLAVGIRLLAESLGHPTSLHYIRRPPTAVIEGRTVNQRDTWVVKWEAADELRRKQTVTDDTHRWSRVRSVVEGRKAVEVFDMTVEQDHSYIADGIVVHNCQHHTQANATKIYQQGRQTLLFDDGEEFDDQAFARSERSRMTMACVLRYAARNRPEIIVTENVVEVCQWGPGKDGSTFRWWLGELTKLGYEYECCFFNSQFFPPCPQSRDRVYIVAWRRGNKKPDLDYRPVAYCISQRCGGRIVNAVQTWKPRTKTWPLPRWGKYGQKRQYLYTCPECRAEVEPAAWPAWTAINWNNLGIPLWEREKYGLPPLKPATLERIRRGLTKFSHYPPVVLPTKAQWGTEHSVAAPFATQTTQQDKALVTSGVVAQRTDNVPASMSEQVGPVTTSGGGGHALISAAVIPQRSHTNGEHVTGHVDPLTTHGDMSLASFVLPVCGKTKDYQRGGHVSESTYTQQTTPKLALASMLIKNNGDESEAKYRALPVIDPFGALTTSPTQSLASMVLAAKGHTFERGEYVRARHVAQQFFTQHTSEAYAVATSQIVAMRGGGGMDNQKPVTEPTGTVTAGGMHHGLMTPALFAKFNGGPDDTSWHHTGEPFNTVTTHDTHGMIFRPWVEQFLAGADSVHVTEQFATVMTHLRHALAGVEQEPGDPVTDDDLMRVCFRMLEPDPELRYVMAFGPTYILLGNKTQKTAGLGNAVTPPVASWLTARCLETLR